MGNRIFREVEEKWLPPTSTGKIWLKPGAGSYWLMVYKPEAGRWISLNETTWADILDKPYMLEDETTIYNYVVNVAKDAVLGELMADDVAYRYGGDVDVIKALPGELSRGDDELPSVATLLSTIIAKVWFENLKVTATPTSVEVYIGEETKERVVTFTISNLIAGAGSNVSTTSSDQIVNFIVDGDEKGGTITVKPFTPTAQKDYTVTVTAICADSDGKVGGQNVSASSATKAYWPYWCWSSASAEEVGDRKDSYKGMLKSNFKFQYIQGSHYYHLLVPNEIKYATQANTGDWNGNFKLVSHGDVTIAGRKYYFYRSPNAVTGVEAKSVDVTVQLTSTK